MSLDHVLSGEPWSPPTVVYIILSLATFDPASTGASCGEVDGASSYLRVAVTCNSTNFPLAVNGSKANNAVFTFPTATGSWGTVFSFYISDAATEGNLFYGADLTAPREISAGDSASFAIGAINLDEV